MEGLEGSTGKKRNARAYSLNSWRWITVSIVRISRIFVSIETLSLLSFPFNSDAIPLDAEGSFAEYGCIMFHWTQRWVEITRRHYYRTP